MTSYTRDITVSYWESEEYIEQHMKIDNNVLTKYLQGFDKYLVGTHDSKLVAIRTDFIVWLRED